MVFIVVEYNWKICENSKDSKIKELPELKTKLT